MVRSAGLRVTRVAKRSRRKLKPTPASASTVERPSGVACALEVRMWVTQGTNSG